MLWRKEKVREAVSAVFVHRDRVFAIKRQPYLAAFPGYHAFPGGKVDLSDSTAPSNLPWLKDHPPNLMGALCRELQEELDFDLEAAIAAGKVAFFGELAVATTPPFHTHRFHNHFYKIELAEPLSLAAGEDEAEVSGWMALKSLVDLYHQGRLLAVPPIVTMIKALAENPAVQFISDVNLSYDEKREVPCLEAVHGLWQLPARSQTLPPADRTNAFIVGDFLVDPSPRDRRERDRLLCSVARFEVNGIFLTHHHGDHIQFADDIARAKGWPIVLSEDTRQRIGACHRGFFDGIETRIIREGETLTTWLGKNVRVWAVPGHDEGHLALAPETLEWFIVGDLIQGIGTVVISAPEGHMGRYFRTLEKVIDLDPAIIIPSHGIAMGTTFRLRETLKHRRLREKQVLEFHESGKSKREMLGLIYKGLHPRLVPLAMANITSHMEKLREEGRI